MVKKTHYIYGLIDPLTDQLRYIGRTNNLNSRLSQHITKPCSDEMSNWIKDLASYNERPRMITLQACDGLDPKKTEASWIKVASYLGAALINGEGSVKGLIAIVKTRKMYNLVLEENKKLLAINEALKSEIIKLSTGLDIAFTRAELPELDVEDSHAFLIETN